MYHLYKLVPQCKLCGSWRTGIYVHGLIDDSFIIKNMLRLGIYVMTTPDSNDNYNCFCGTCGVQWHEDDIPLKLLNKEDYHEQLQLRGIEESLDNVKNLYNEDKLAVKKEIEKKKKEKRLFRKLARKLSKKRSNDKATDFKKNRKENS